MTSQEKAQELVDGFKQIVKANEIWENGEFVGYDLSTWEHTCKELALLSVDNTLNSIKKLYNEIGNGFIGIYIDEWKEVKKEIENL